MLSKVIKKRSHQIFPGCAMICLFWLWLNSCTNRESESRIQMLDGARISDLVRNQAGEQEAVMAQISFGSSFHSFDSIRQGSRVSHSFVFKNTGRSPLLISSVKSTCGCTIPGWPTGVIPPGEGGEINVEFDSAERSGKVTKEITVLANTKPAETILTIQAIVN